MKKTILIIFLLIVSCSSDDDISASFDVNLLYDQWNFISLCPDQNNLVFNEDGTYILTESGNTCDENEQNTYAYAGTYTLNGDNLSLIQISEELIEEGTNHSPSTSDFAEMISQKIITLTETELVIERRFNLSPEFRNWVLTRQQ